MSTADSGTSNRPETTTHSAATTELCTDDGKIEESTMEDNLREKFLKASDQIEKMIENDEVLPGSEIEF